MTIEWPDVPPSLNKVLRQHWAKRRQEAGKWFAVLHYMPIAERQKLVDASKAGKRVRMSITLHNARQFDKDNSYGAVKVIVDAAKQLGYMRDDSPAYLDLDVQQVKSTRKGKKTVISMEVL